MLRLLILLSAMASAAIAALVLIPWVLRKSSQLIHHIGMVVSAVFQDSLQILSSTMAALAYVGGALSSITMGRWRAAAHHGRCLEREVRAAALATYRLCVRHPLVLVGLGQIADSLEERVRAEFARAPGPDGPAGPAAGFAGYQVLRSLPAGGSGAHLYVARPDAPKRAELARAGARAIPSKVVIKSFSLSAGSELPQLVRESRALEASRKLGLVLEHVLEGERFFYVMPFVPGDDLGVVGRELHRRCGSGGLDRAALHGVLAYLCDLLCDLESYHRAGLWHKDIKPENIIISSGRAHLVDLGLVTPLQSAMTLTTHGTEYYRDPELVRMALRGAKVHEVDGVRFDIFGVGAVLYSLIENSFPAHGSLSRITRSCPEALKWIVRRAMAEVRNRYPDAATMRRDLQFLAEADDPFGMRPVDLPSMSSAPPPIESATTAAETPVASAPEAPRSPAGTRAQAPPRPRTSFGHGCVLVVALGLALIGAAVLLLPVGTHVVDDPASAPGGYRSAEGQGYDSTLLRSPRSKQIEAVRVVHLHRRALYSPARGYPLLILDTAGAALSAPRAKLLRDLQALGFAPLQPAALGARDPEVLGKIFELRGRLSMADSSEGAARILREFLLSRSPEGAADALLYISPPRGPREQVFIVLVALAGLPDAMAVFEAL